MCNDKETTGKDRENIRQGVIDLHPIYVIITAYFAVYMVFAYMKLWKMLKDTKKNRVYSYCGQDKISLDWILGFINRILVGYLLVYGWTTQISLAVFLLTVLPDILMLRIKLSTVRSDGVSHHNSSVEHYSHGVEQ